MYLDIFKMVNSMYQISQLLRYFNTVLHLEIDVIGKYEIGSKMRINMNAFLHSAKSKAFLTKQKIFRNRFI